MGCKINSFYLTIPGKSSVENLPKNNPAFYFSPFYCKNEARPASSTEVTRRADLNVDFKTLEACKLGIARYPDFEYDARGGTGTGLALQPSSKDDNDEIPVSFDLETVYIPPLTSATTKFLGLPLPPFLRIDIVPELFQGSIGRESGKVYLRFKAKFCFSVGSFYRAPPLIVETVLTSEESNGKMRGGRGERLDKEGNCCLVGVATVEPINDVLMNSFLGLPTECLDIPLLSPCLGGCSWKRKKFPQPNLKVGNGSVQPGPINQREIPFRHRVIRSNAPGLLSFFAVDSKLICNRNQCVIRSYSSFFLPSSSYQS